MKIAVVGTRGFPNVQGGVETHCENLYTELAKRGCDITVFSRKPYVDAELKEFKGVRLSPVRAVKSKFFEALLHTGQSIIHARLKGAQIVHIHAIGPSIWAPLARLLGMKVVVTNHGADYDRAKWAGSAKKFLMFSEKVGAKSAHKVISISGLISRHLQEAYNVDAALIPNGVHPPRRKPDGSVLKRFDLTAHKYILSVGRLVPEKGMHDLMEAFVQTGMAADGWKLVIAGAADHKGQYSQTLLQKAGGIPGVVMTGFLKADLIHELYAARGLFVLASYHEGLPIALLEALYHGPDCVISDIPANREVGLPGDRYFKTGNVQDLARKILHYTGHTETAELDGHFDVKELLKDYAWDRIADETLIVYKNLLKGKTKTTKSGRVPAARKSSPNRASATLVQDHE